MRRLGLTLSLCGALLLGACTPVTLSETVGSVLGGGGLTTSIKNPAGKKELASVELSYQATAKLFVACRRAKCTSVANLRKYQEYDRHAYAAIVAARKVVRENPTISGLSAVVAARKAVADYQSALGR